MATGRQAHQILRQSLYIQPRQLQCALPRRLAHSTSPWIVNRHSNGLQTTQKERRHGTVDYVRQFHTSPRLGAAGDNSTIDFAYLPSIALEGNDETSLLRVPIIPDDYSTTINAPVEMPAVPLMPEISTVSADAVFLPMADLSDGHALNIDFHAMADRVAANLKRAKNVAPEEQAGLIKQLWNDMVDDMIGRRKK